MKTLIGWYLLITSWLGGDVRIDRIVEKKNKMEVSNE